MTYLTSMSDSSPIVSLVSLGCAKNEVDSEYLLGGLLRDGFVFAEDPCDADICLVNTCGFIKAARDETREVLEELVQNKRNGRPENIIALGCMVERASDYPDFSNVMNACDLQIGFKDYPQLASLCRQLIEQDEPDSSGRSHSRDDPARMRIGFPHLAFLKISEGCSNGCSFCTIPRIRGRQVSRSVTEIINEAISLVESGTREIAIIAQDTTSYGRDTYGRPALADLLRELSGVVPEEIWIRLMYAYPRYLTDEVLDIMASDHRFCPYFDIPLQHISDRILNAMGRRTDKQSTIGLLNKIRTKIPDAAIRTTFITGFPEETDEEFSELLKFVKEEQFSHVGVFTYSEEPLTTAAKFTDSVPQDVKEQRRNAVMEEQLEVSRRLLRQYVGSSFDVMIDDWTPPGAKGLPEGCTALGHSRFQAPEVDGLILICGEMNPQSNPGDIVSVRIDSALDYDLIGSVC